MIYAGIGSRQTPKNVLNTIIKIGSLFAKKGYILRSGGASGADAAFETGCDIYNGKKEIYLPWKNFNDNMSSLYSCSKDAFKLAEKYHPRWNSLSWAAKQLHSRNCYQILGNNLNTPVNFVICWTDGTGGTAQALRIAIDMQINIFNIFDKYWNKKLLNFFEINSMFKEGV